MLLLPLALVACRPPFVVIAVEDPANVAGDAASLKVGAADGQLTTLDLAGRSLPLSVTVTADEPGERELQLEASDADGTALARVRAVLTFSREDRLPSTVALRKACAADATCDNGLFCDGPETCRDGFCVDGADPCPASDVECVDVSCSEDDGGCVVDLQHEQCGYPDERRYCDRADGCRDGVVCADGADCDNTIDCDGLEVCVDEHCEPGPPVRLDDANPCTLDSCREIVGVEHTPLPDGSPCPFSGDVSFDGACVAGECVERPPVIPPNPFLRLVDETTGSPFLTQAREVGVELYAPLAVAYLVDEDQASPPATDDPRWELQAPETLVLSDGFGKKTVYAWVLSEDGLMNLGVPASSATIRYTDDVVRVGPTPTSCPAETGGACDFTLEDGAHPLQMAADAAASDQTIWLYPPADGDVWRPVVLFTDRLTLEGAPGFEPRDQIVIENDGGYAVRVLGEETVVRDLHLSVRGGRAIEADGRFSLFERLYIEGAAAPTEGGSPRKAMLASRSFTLRDTFVWGWFHGLMEIGAQPGGVDPEHYQVVHNTVVQWRSGDAVHFNEGCLYEAVNNVFVSLDPTSEAAFVGGSLVDGTRFANNLVWGWGAGANIFLAEREESVLIVPPGLTDMLSPTLALASPALDAGTTHPAASPVDLLGNLRAPDGAPDIGAVEASGALELGLGALGAVRVGPAADGCPLATSEPCDFVVADAQEEVLQEVLDRVPTDTIVELYGDPGSPTVYRVDNVVVSRTLTLRRAEAVPREAVVLATSDDESTALRLIQGDDVVLVGLDFRCKNCVAVHVYPGSSASAALDARLSGLRVHVTGDGSRAAFRLGTGSHLSSSATYGGAGRFFDLQSADVFGALVVNNTFHSTNLGS